MDTRRGCENFNGSFFKSNSSIDENCTYGGKETRRNKLEIGHHFALSLQELQELSPPPPPPPF